MQRMGGVSERESKDTYKFANSIMKSLLQQEGYRSLAEFEHVAGTCWRDCFRREKVCKLQRNEAEWKSIGL
jgi:hypothetical protein